MVSAAASNAQGPFKDAGNVKIAVAVYRHEDWQKMLDLPNPTCKDKEELAYKISRPRIPFDGSEVETWVT